MKNENAIMDRIKARIAYHANEHRHTYEIGKGVMDFLARDLLADFKAAGGLLPPVALDGDVYVIYRRKPVKAKVIFIGINADRLFFFNVLRGNIKANFQTYQFTENDIGRSVFLTLEEANLAKRRDGDYCIKFIERTDAGLPSPIHADDDRVVRCDCFEAIPEEGDSE